MSEIQVNGASIYYESRGSGYPLILIAGLTRDHTTWEPIIDALAEHFQVVRFDNRGVGRTKDDGRELSAELMAEDIRALAQALRLKKPHIIGQSMGGSIAQKFAATYPEETGKLGLLVTSAKWRKAVLLGLRSRLALRQLGVDENVVLDGSIPWVFGEKFFGNPANVEMLRKATLENPYPQAVEDYARQMVVLDRFDGRGDLKKIRAPCLVMYGKEDILSLPFESEFLAKQISQAKIEAFEGAHGLIQEVPEALASSIIRFLKEL
jgi:3-oxoadipate enol-lactonase